MDTCAAQSNCEIYFNLLNFELLNKFWCRGNKCWWYYCGQWFSSTTTPGNVFNNNTKKLISYWIIHKRQLQSQIVIKRITVKTNTFPSIFATPTSRCFSTILIPSLYPSPHPFACLNLPRVLQFMQHQTPMWLWTTSLLHLLTW